MHAEDGQAQQKKNEYGPGKSYGDEGEMDAEIKVFLLFIALTLTFIVHLIVSPGKKFFLPGDVESDNTSQFASTYLFVLVPLYAIYYLKGKTRRYASFFFLVFISILIATYVILNPKKQDTAKQDPPKPPVITSKPPVVTSKPTQQLEIVALVIGLSLVLLLSMLWLYKRSKQNDDRGFNTGDAGTVLGAYPPALGTTKIKKKLRKPRKSRKIRKK